MEREQHRPLGEKVGQRSPLAFLRRQLERWRGRERGWMRHEWDPDAPTGFQNNFTSTTSPASTMSVWAGISTYPSASDMLVMSPEALNAGMAVPSTRRTV
jgi:hypothetical protein